MNEQLLQTTAVKSSIEHYIKIELTFQEIKERLENIHLIIVENEELKAVIDEIKKNM